MSLLISRAPDGEPRRTEEKVFPLPYRRECVIECTNFFFFLSFVVRGEQFIELQSEILNKTHSPYPSRLPLLE